VSIYPSRNFIIVIFVILSLGGRTLFQAVSMPVDIAIFAVIIGVFQMFGQHREPPRNSA
jgi:hypothetical protein